MQKFFISLIICLLAIPAALAENYRFVPVDVFIDSDSKPLAAYQFELIYDPVSVKLVGVEGGEGVFQKPPYYDPKGLESGRIIVAAFTTDGNTPSGRVRIARIHLAYSSEAAPELQAELGAAADNDGEKIRAAVELEFVQGGK